MRIRDVGLSLLGSAVVYVSMAACNAGGGGGSMSGAGVRTGATGGGSGPVASAGAGGTGGTSGTASAGGTNGANGAGGTSATSTAAGAPGPDSGLVDALTDPVPTASADPTDGTRLKATYRLGADGSKEYVPGIWFDSMRSESCAFTLAGDGQQRCLPAGTQGGMFSDSSCTMPIAAVPSGCTTPTYVTIADATTCGTGAGGMHIYALGASTSPTQLYVSSGTQCYSGGPAATGYGYFSVGAEIAPASFVEATAGHD